MNDLLEALDTQLISKYEQIRAPYYNHLSYRWIMGI